jgi:Pyruvate/2-oxoacid:ferredoxin oxidoreductase delta subunit
MDETQTTRRVIQVNKSIIGPAEPRRKTVRAKKPNEYPGVPRAYLDVARKLSSPLLLGPPICDELVAFVEHTFTEEEAGIVRHLNAVKARTARQVARAARRPVDEIGPILQALDKKRTIGCDGPAEKRRYRLMPVMPGMFEMVLIGESPDSMTDWHRRFAELFEALFETGYTLDYADRPAPFVRYLPVGGVLSAHPAALPSDQLEFVLDRYDQFGVGHCQCRMSTPPLGRGCGRPLEVCTAMGVWAEIGIEAGWLRSVSKQGLLEIKREAESHGLVTFIVNVESAKGQASCSCCGCCCKALRSVTEFNAPGAIAPPHFMPRFDATKCIHCGRCANACPTGAITVDTERKTLRHEPARCIGCGLCQLACDRQHAIAMHPVPDYRLPYKSWLSFILGNAPKIVQTSWKVWRSR